MRHILRMNERDYAAALAQGDVLLLDNTSLTASLTMTSGSAATVTVDGHVNNIHMAGDDDHRFIWMDGENYEVTVLEPLAIHAKPPNAAGGLEARAPMPGNVVALPISVGDAVRANDVLVIIESMKLEVVIRAPQAGHVAEIRCAVGRSFGKDALLVLLRPDGGTSANQ